MQQKSPHQGAFIVRVTVLLFDRQIINEGGPRNDELPHGDRHRDGRRSSTAKRRSANRHRRHRILHFYFDGSRQFLGLRAFTLGGGGGHAAPTQAGAAAGITIGCGAGIEPVNVSAHTMPAAATTTRMKPRMPSFLTIPYILLSTNSLYLSNST